LSRLATVGDNVIDIYPALGRVFPGGNTVNVAVAARRSGASAAYVGAVGVGPDGAIVRAALAAEQIETTRIRVLDGPNAYSTIDVVDGDRVFGSHDLGVSVLRLDKNDLEYLGQFWCVHTGDCSSIEDQLGDLAAVARVSFDFSDRPADYYQPLLRHVWFACFSGSHLTSDQAVDLAHWAASAGPEFVLVTEGPRGALLRAADGKIRRVPARPEQPVDTLGAGDSVIGGVLARLMLGDAPETALRAGQDLAAISCAHYGAFGYGENLDHRWAAAIA
jgi:sugar/nucleoside kinase (ribokinase family)